MKDVMKKAILLLACFILCSCTVKNENTLTIEKDGKLKYNVLIAFDKSLIETLIKANIIESDDEIDQYVSENIKDNYLNGFVESEYNDGEYIGNEYVYEVENIDAVSTDKNISVFLNQNSVVETKMFTKKDNVYIANFLYNLNNKYNYRDVDFINKFTVHLPVKAISSNADEILNDGKTLVWNIRNGESKAIRFNFSFASVGSDVSAILIIFDALILGAILFLFIKRRKKKNEEKVY